MLGYNVNELGNLVNEVVPLGSVIKDTPPLRRTASINILVGEAGIIHIAYTLG